MRHIVIFSHPNQKSFTASVAAAYAAAAKSLGHEVVIRDLYRMSFDPRLKSTELPWDRDFALDPDIIAERALIGDGDIFALIYPLWLNTPPAMLKGYLERVFGFGFAYGRDGRSEPLLAGRFLISFSSSGAPFHWVRETGAFDALRSLFDRYFAELCGLTFIEHIHFGSITPGATRESIETRLSDVRDAVQRHFGETANHAWRPAS